MRNMLAFLAAAALTVGGVGWYLGWFGFSSQPGNDGHRQINIDINGNKLAQDASKAARAAQELADKHQQQGAQDAGGDQKNKTAEAGRN